MFLSFKAYVVPLCVVWVCAEALPDGALCRPVCAALPPSLCSLLTLGQLTGRVWLPALIIMACASLPQQQQAAGVLHQQQRHPSRSGQDLGQSAARSRSRSLPVHTVRLLSDQQPPLHVQW
jgi:hypothetical protein